MQGSGPDGQGGPGSIGPRPDGERLLTEIPVTADALFWGSLTNVIVQEAKRAKNWDKFTKAAGHAGLQKITAISSQADDQSSSPPPRKGGGSGFRRSDSTKRKDSSRCQKDQRSGSPAQKPFQRMAFSRWKGQWKRWSRFLHQLEAVRFIQEERQGLQVLMLKGHRHLSSCRHRCSRHPVRFQVPSCKVASGTFPSLVL